MEIIQSAYFKLRNLKNHILEIFHFINAISIHLLLSHVDFKQNPSWCIIEHIHKPFSKKMLNQLVILTSDYGYTRVGDTHMGNRSSHVLKRES